MEEERKIWECGFAEGFEDSDCAAEDWSVGFAAHGVVCDGGLSRRDGGWNALIFAREQ